MKQSGRENEKEKTMGGKLGESGYKFGAVKREGGGGGGGGSGGSGGSERELSAGREAGGGDGGGVGLSGREFDSVLSASKKKGAIEGRAKYM